MGKIKVLSKHLAELIAAGEVVERPGSAVKELLENAIDSGATKISVKINCGGIGAIQVTDNGSGIEKTDVRTAFKKNATSKIKDEVDLYKISTLGFRGEALASICSVSKVEVITKTKNEPFGTHYKINGGEEILFEEGSCPNGTTIIVKDIFYNVPARMKFLKSNKYEGNVISKIVERLALSHPEVGIKFFKDKNEELTTIGNSKAMSAIYAVYGKNFSESLIPVEYASEALKIEGYITKPEASAASRNNQVFFVNRRYIKSNTVKSALEEAYKGFSMVGKFPSCILYIEAPYDFLDVNVHPAKTEVRFNDEKAIYSLVYYGVKTALNTLISCSFPFSEDRKIARSNIQYSSKDVKKDKDLVNFEKKLVNKYINKKMPNNSVAYFTPPGNIPGSLQLKLNNRPFDISNFKETDIQNIKDQTPKNINPGNADNHSDKLLPEELALKVSANAEPKPKPYNKKINFSTSLMNFTNETSSEPVYGYSNLEKNYLNKTSDQIAEVKHPDPSDIGRKESFSENSLEENQGTLSPNYSPAPKQICNTDLKFSVNNLRENEKTPKSNSDYSNSFVHIEQSNNVMKFTKNPKNKLSANIETEEKNTTNEKYGNSLVLPDICNLNNQREVKKIHKNPKSPEKETEEEHESNEVTCFSSSNPKNNFDIKNLEKEEIAKRLIGEAFKTYIILEVSKSEIMFIDKHAAHERIIYERIKSQNRAENRQILIEPVIISLNKDEHTEALSKKSLLADLGFVIENFGENTLIVRSVPLWISPSEIKKIILELISDMIENKKSVESSKLDWIYKNVACRAAIKANDNSKREELIALVQQIKEKNIKYCPHGRPVYYIVSKLELEKRFFRK